MLGRIGIAKISSEYDNKDKGSDLVAKLCFILLAKGYLDEIDNDFMLDKTTFNDWKEHVEESLSEDEEQHTQEDDV